jgi:hypothetical protein
MMPTPIEWPTVKIGGKNKLSGRTLTFRVSFAAHYLLNQWCGTDRVWTDFEWAAASAGEFDKRGEWHSLNIPPIELADILSRDQEVGKPSEWIDAIQAAAVLAVEKANPGPVAFAAPGSLTIEKKIDGSEVGPSALAETA